MLERDRAGDRRIARINIGRAPRFVIRQENLADAAILESAHGRGVGQSLGSKRKVSLTLGSGSRSRTVRMACSRDLLLAFKPRSNFLPGKIDPSIDATAFREAAALIVSPAP
jgi:hypothetical protein